MGKLIQKINKYLACTQDMFLLLFRLWLAYMILEHEVADIRNNVSWLPLSGDAIATLCSVIKVGVVSLLVSGFFIRYIGLFLLISARDQFFHFSIENIANLENVIFYLILISVGAGKYSVSEPS